LPLYQQIKLNKSPHNVYKLLIIGGKEEGFVCVVWFDLAGKKCYGVIVKNISNNCALL